MTGTGLIIQGPLTSRGRGGAKAHVPIGDLVEGDIYAYDCRENIRRIIREFGRFFDVIVVSTWDDQLRAGDEWPGATVTSLPDPGGIQTSESSLYTYKANNKYRQFIGLREGLRMLRSLAPIDYVIKMRTDQYVNLEVLLDELRERARPNMIYVPFIHPKTYLISDHYFAARTSDMQDFCDAVLGFEKFEFISCVHREMVLKHAFALHKKKIGVPNWAYFPWWPPHGSSAATKKIFAFMLANVYGSLGPAVLRSAEWRGNRFSDEYLAERMAGQHRLPVGYSVPALVSIDWRRHFAFKARAEHRTARVYDGAIIMLGRSGWRFWNAFKALVREARKVLV